MTTINLSPREAAFLIVAVENPKIREMFESLVKSYMEISGESEGDAKKAIFPVFLEAVKSLAAK